MEPDYKRKKTYYRYRIADVYSAFIIAFYNQLFRYNIY